MEKTKTKEGKEGGEILEAAAEVVQEKQNEDVQKKGKEGKSLDTRLIALFILGALVGITLKTHALSAITMGPEDYKIGKFKDDFRVVAEEIEEVEEDEIFEEEIMDDTEAQEQGNEILLQDPGNGDVMIIDRNEGENVEE